MSSIELQLFVPIADSYQSRQEMDVFTEMCYYKYNQIFLSVIGLWPFQDVKTRRIRLSFVSVCLMIILSVQLAKFLTTYCSVNLFVEILSNFLLCFCIVLTFITAYINENKLKELLEQIKFDWTKLETEEERKIFQKYANETLLLFGSVNAISLSTLIPILLNIVAPLNESRPYEIPFPVELFFDTTKYFYVTFFLIFFLLNIMGCVSIGLYGLVLMILQHCNGLFELVGYIWENSVEDGKEIFTNKENKKIYKRIIRGVWFHKRTIKFIANINSVCQNCYLIQIIFLGILIGIDILRILNMKLTMDNFKEIMICMFHIIGNVVWAFINCYFGQRVIDRSSDVHTKICNARWYSSSTKIQKLILLIITRSMKPSCVSIGGTFASSLELFASMVQTSISYAMVLHSL